MDFYPLHLPLLNEFLVFTLGINEWVFTFYICQYQTVFILHNFVTSCMTLSNDPLYYDKRGAPIGRPKIIIIIIVFLYATNLCLKQAVMSLKKP